MTYQYTLLEYPASLQAYYQKLSHLPGFVLLESIDHRYGRYDIVSAYPYDRILIKENTPELSALLEQGKKKLSLVPSDCDLPFQGGAIGYVSYDLGAKLQGLHSKALPTLQDLPLMDLGLYDWAIVVDHVLKKTVFFAAHTQTSTSDIAQEVLALWHAETAENQLGKFALDSDFLPLLSKESYKRSFDAIYQALKEGRSYQVNFTQPFEASYTGELWELYKKVSLKNPVPFSAFLRGEKASILSFSPERFLLQDGGRLVSSPIKGTIARSTNPREDEQLKKQLIHSLKNQAEHVMIVDLLRNDLGKISLPGSVKVPSFCSIQSYQYLHHMVSDIEGYCGDTMHPLEVFFSCFPGGSITGAPKLESMRIIHEQEKQARGVYCGSIGYFSSHGRFDMNIAIRTMTAKEGILHLAAGGGIVIDSLWEEEYQECYLKIAAIIGALQGA